MIEIKQRRKPKREEEYPASNDPIWDEVAIPLSEYLGQPRTIIEVRAWAMRNHHPVKQIERGLSYVVG